jgi:hypothetical protein
MINFFRRIRRNLSSENKFSRYLIYAIGEIVLVVIGILIALQINNWNESNKDRELVKTSLTSLKVNINEDINDLNKQIAYNKTLLKNIDFALKLIVLPDYENKRLSIYSDSIGDLTKERSLIPNNTTYKSMESGSVFPLIANQKFKESIYKYYVQFDALSSLTKENNLFVKERIEDFVYNKVELGTYFPESNPHSMNRDLRLDNTNIFRNNPAFENALIGRKFRAGGEINMSENAISAANELIKLIDNYLDLNN